MSLPMSMSVFDCYAATYLPVPAVVGRGGGVHQSLPGLCVLRGDIGHQSGAAVGCGGQVQNPGQGDAGRGSAGVVAPVQLRQLRKTVE